MQRLGINQGGYRGEGIAIDRVLTEIQAEALKRGWRAEPFLTLDSLCLRTYFRPGNPARKRLYISSGIHGDEPAGPLAILELLKRDSWPAHIDLWLCPCINPTGFIKSTRENIHGVDLNRDYRHLTSEEVRSHVRWLQQQPQFDSTLILHEDWEANGFYLYELNPHQLPSLADKIISSVSKVCPIDTAPLIDGWPAEAGIIRPQVAPADRPQWAEAVYLISNKTQQSYTLEAPSDFPVSTRVAALVTAVETVLSEL